MIVRKMVVLVENNGSVLIKYLIVGFRNLFGFDKF